AAIGVEAELIVHLALFGVAENVEGFLDVFEFFFGGFVAGVDVGVVFAGELLVGTADLVGRGLSRDGSGFVISVLGGRHKKLSAISYRLSAKTAGAGFARPGGTCRSGEPRYFLSSTSTNSASTTLSPFGWSPPGGGCWPSPVGGC